jgi:hypothetical protein
MNPAHWVLWGVVAIGAASVGLLLFTGACVLADRRWQSRAEKEYARRFVEQAGRRRLP